MRVAAMLALIVVLLAGACQNVPLGPGPTPSLENSSDDGGGGGGDGGGGY